MKNLGTAQNKQFEKKFSTQQKIAAIGAAVLCASSGFAAAANKNKCNCECDSAPFYAEHALLKWQPEVGMDLGFTRTKFQQGQGDKLLNRTQFPINVFFGLNFTERFGVEIGYSETRRKNKNKTLGPREFAPGADANGQYQQFETSLSMSQPSISLTYKYPVGEKIKLFGAVGFTSMKIKSAWKNIDNVGIAIIARRSDSMEIRKNIPMLRAGMYYLINDSFSLRFLTSWYKTSKLEYYKPVKAIAGCNPMLIKLKNSIQYSFGIAYSI